MRPPDPIWIFHRGALGDSVLLWPALRALVAAGHSVTLVSDSSKARLAARFTAVQPLDAELPAFASLWVPGTPAPDPRPGASLVLSFLADPRADAGRVWLANAARMFPGARIEHLPAPLDRPAALALAARFGPPPDAPPHAPARDAPIVCHVGAGSRAKRWPLDHWARLSSLLPNALPAHPARPARAPLLFIAGEAEADLFDPDERRAFHALAGRFLLSLDDLADLLLHARLFIGADSGPAHLAAAIGTPTLSLFGPTDPARWAPIGPRTHVLAPPAPRPMSWLDPALVARAAVALLPRTITPCPPAS